MRNERHATKRKALRRVITPIAIALLLFSCSTIRYRYQSEEDVQSVVEGYRVETYPKTEFIVFSDPHMFDPALGITGSAFQQYLEKDRKLLAESEAILRTAVARIRERKPDFVLVPGDLTKDGERKSHILFSNYISTLEEQGIAVFVVPGNHDILNPYALRFSGDTTEPVESVTPEEFKTIYRNFGYGEALYQDPASLSYIAEPVEGLWLFALDSAVYETNAEIGHAETDGAFNRDEIAWIEKMLVEALKQNKVPIAMFHHGVIEHYDSQAKHFGQYLIDNYRKAADMFSFYRVPAVFTGHYHAQDIVVRTWDEPGRFLYDIETGSLVTYPCPYRTIAMHEDGTMDVRSFFVDTVEGLDTGDNRFVQYARDFIYNGVNGIAVETMKGLGIKEEEASTLAPQITDAFIAHYRGDEQFTGDEMLTLKGLSLMGRLVVSVRKDLVYGLWDDPPPADNHVRIDLKTGSWEPIK